MADTCPGRCGELTAWLEVILPADAPAPARLASGMSFPTSIWRRRHAAPPSRPTPSETLVEFVVGVSDLRPQFSSTTSGSLEGSAASQSAAAGEQARTPTCLLHLSVGCRIAPPPCPTGANLPDCRLPQPPRAFPVPRWQSDCGSSVKHPLPLRRNVMRRVTLALVGVRRNPLWRVGDVAHGLDNQLLPQCECGAALKHPQPPFLAYALTGRKARVAQV